MYVPQQYYPGQPAPPGGPISVENALREYGGVPTEEAQTEHDDDTRAIMLEDIDMLRTEIAGMGADVSQIPNVDEDTPLRDVKKVHAKLRRMYDRKRCETFGTEAIMAGAHGLEWFFDGKKKYGPWSPDLTDWHNNIRPKLRRMKYETSGVASDLLHGLNINNIGRIILELGISAVLHNKARQTQRGQASYSPGVMNEVYEEIRNYE
jgi:hypothetical protein